MESLEIQHLSALAHPNRLAVFRLLMRRYPDAVPAGEIAEALGLKPNTASVYLSTLRQTDLIEQTRQGTSLLYRANLTTMRGLLGHLMQDCCRNRPEICADALMPWQTQGSHIGTNTRPLNALFICSGNSARSIMAESILRHTGGNRFRAFSAGTEPGKGPHPDVIALLNSKDHDTGPLKSKHISEFSTVGAPAMDFVFTVCDRAANEDCPVWPGQPISAHWGLPDPTRPGPSDTERALAMQQTYGALLNRISTFVSLPLDTLDRISLQQRLDDIGQVQHGSDVPDTATPRPRKTGQT